MTGSNYYYYAFTNTGQPTVIHAGEEVTPIQKSDTEFYYAFTNTDIRKPNSITFNDN